MKKIRLIALLAAFLVFIVGYRMLTMRDSNQSKTLADGQRIEVVVAAQDIGPYTTVTKDMIKLKKVPFDEETKGYYIKTEDVVGKVCVSNIFQEEVLTDRRLQEDNAEVLGLASRLEEGKRAVTIQADIEQGVSNNLRVGNHVDVIFTGTLNTSVPGSEGEIPAGLSMERIMGPQNPSNAQILNDSMGNEFSVIALQDVKVAALGSSFYFDSTVDYKNLEYASVTLEVTPSQAAQIALMKSGGGKIQLALRPQEDNGVANEPRGSVLKNYEEK
ncbi:Flp pilus assembly protein CpaB [Lacrimispora sp.]|uniref:Flp pilus assembly protein CpaB n=1 Tax=Lacrimispora sp. TaxID=2719234 RepID=UPI0028AA4F99|nr:Flp pilus assembly protein CpaB [Lacrimispora sp.]